MVDITESYPEINGAVTSEGDYKPLSNFDDSFGAEYPTDVPEEAEHVAVPSVEVPQGKATEAYKPGPLEKRFDTLQETMDADSARLIVGPEALDAEMSASLAAQTGETLEIVIPKAEVKKLDYKTGPAFVHDALEAAKEKRKNADTDKV